MSDKVKVAVRVRPLNGRGNNCTAMLVEVLMYFVNKIADRFHLGVLICVSEIDLGTNVVVEMDETQTWLAHPTAKDRRVTGDVNR